MPILVYDGQNVNVTFKIKSFFLLGFSAYLADFFYTSSGLCDASDPEFLNIRIWIFLPDSDPDLRKKGQDLKK